MEERNIKETFLRLKSSYPQRSFLYYGSDKYKRAEILQEIKNITVSFISAGRQAKASGRCICILIEDLHNSKKSISKSYAMPYQEPNQLNLPIIAFMTGIPSIIHMLGRASSYSERLFDYTETV